MVLITDGLSLRSSGEDETQTVVKSRLFYRYYLHFVKVLERSNASEVSAYARRARLTTRWNRSIPRARSLDDLSIPRSCTRIRRL
jgi:hypothetical protein